jgi:SAM-dependent methyltransferase
MWCALPPNPKTVLDIGCGSGMGLAGLVTRGITVVGVDVDPKAIAKARLRLSEVRLMDVERDSWPADWLGRFDVVAFCDSLEHFDDPWSVLRATRPLLRGSGRVVASVPNLRQWRMLAKLALGQWHYHDGPGIMNRGHLRFFTAQTARDLFTESGYREPTLYFPRRTFHLGGPERVLNALTLGVVPEIFYASLTISAEPIDEIIRPAIEPALALTR